MKKIFHYLLAFATLSLGLSACNDPVEENTETEAVYPTIRVIEESIDIIPSGNADEPTTFNIEAEGTWTIEALDEYDWIEITPATGEGNATLNFVASINETGKERSAEFLVKESFAPINADKLGSAAQNKEIVTYEFFITQNKLESNLGEGTYEFIHAIVEGKMLGENTPTVDNWFNVDEQFAGITMNNVDGKLKIISLSGSGFTGLPEVMNLPELTTISCRGAQMNCELPQEWNTPRLTYLNMAVCGLYGLIPEGLASTTPNLVQIFLDQNNLYGALPHEWAAGINTLEVAILNNHANKDKGTKYYDSKDNSALGYLVPRTLDVRMNTIGEDGSNLNGSDGSHQQGDYTQLKLGGVFEGNFEGYEAGWGQHRVIAAGYTDDEYTWNISRTLWDSPAGHSNMGYEGRMQAIPAQMMTWDEAAADEWSAKAKRLNDTRNFEKLDQTAPGE